MIIKRILFIVFSVILSLSVLGCKDEKGKGFIGHWYEVGEKKNPTDINISYKDGVFHVDENRAYLDIRGQTYSISKLEAKAESDDVISGNFFTMRLEKGKLHYNGEEYVKK